MTDRDTFHAQVVALSDLKGRPARRAGLLTVLRHAVGLRGGAINNARSPVIANPGARRSREHAHREPCGLRADHVESSSSR